MTTAELNAEFFRQMSYIADDEKDIRQLVSTFFRNGGFDVEGFEDGASLYKKMETDMPDLIILDIMMTKAEILSDFSEACQDIKLAREGKLQGRPLEDLLNEL